MNVIHLELDDWEMEESSSLSMDEEEFPLWVEVSDVEDDIENNGSEVESVMNGSESTDSDREEAVTLECEVHIASLRAGEKVPQPQDKKIAYEQTLAKI